VWIQEKRMRGLTASERKLMVTSSGRKKGSAAWECTVALATRNFVAAVVEEKGHEGVLGLAGIVDDGMARSSARRR